MPGPYAIRVRTPDGWQDIAMIGPQGPPGSTGPQGPSGPPGYQVYMWFGDGENPNTVDIPGTTTPTLIPLYVPSAPANRISKSDGTNPDFVLNPNNTIKVLQDGFYEITAIVEIFGPHATAQVFVSQLSLADSPTGTDTTLWGVIDQADYGPTQTTPNYSRPTHNHSVGLWLNAGQHVGLQGFVNSVTASTRCRYFSIARTGTGPPGPQGPSGTVTVYEQPATPASPAIGSVWIDTDDPVSQGPILGPPLVSSLPVSPYDGQEVRYLADATNGVIWSLRYRVAAAGVYKWEFVGGGDLESDSLAQYVHASFPSATWALFADAPRGVKVPLAGNYDITHGCSAAMPSPCNIQIGVYADVGGLAPPSGSATSSDVYQASASNFVNLHQRRRVLTIAPNTTFQTMAYQNGAVASLVRRGWYMAARPVNVG